MTKAESKTASAAVKDILLSDPHGLHEVIRAVMQEVLEAEMDEALGASKGERTPEQLGYRSGYYGRTLVTRVGKLELRVPQDRARPLLYRAFRALRAFGAGLGGHACGDVFARRFDPEGQGDHGRAVRPWPLGLVDLGHQQTPGREPESVSRAPASSSLLPTSSSMLAARGCARPASS